jgi:hypothetical protein
VEKVGETNKSKSLIFYFFKIRKKLIILNILEDVEGSQRALQKIREEYEKQR